MMRRSLQRRRAARLVACLLSLFLTEPRPGEAGAVQAAAPAGGPKPAITIEHEAPGCIAAGKYSRVAACFRPPARLARARVYFRKGGASDWFYVEMAGSPPCLQGILPRTKKGVETIEYYLAATDRVFAEVRTPERVVRVTADGRCDAGPVAPVADSAGVVTRLGNRRGARGLRHRGRRLAAPHRGGRGPRRWRRCCRDRAGNDGRPRATVSAVRRGKGAP